MPKSNGPGALFSFFLLLLILGLTGFFAVYSDYYTYVSSTIENVASAGALPKEKFLTRFASKTKKYDTEVKYRKFYITVPGAKKVELAADFNRWGQDPIELKAYRKGYFETSVALTAGEYKYVFVVDGDDVLDPMNEDRQWVGSRRVCVKTVK